MPRTRPSKKIDETPIQKLRKQSKFDRLIFYKYYDGLKTNGMLGFKVDDKAPVESTKHRTGIFEILTKDQFRSKAKKIYLIAKAFIEKEEDPPQELRPQFTFEEVQEMVKEKPDERTLKEKISIYPSAEERFIFFQYYDGYKTDGKIGFSPNTIAGSVNHKRTYLGLLGKLTDSQFRDKGKKLSELAKEFVEKNETPNILRPQFERSIPIHLCAEAHKKIY